MNLKIITLLNKEMQPIFQLLKAGRVLQETFTLPKGFETTTVPKEKRGKEQFFYSSLKGKLCSCFGFWTKPLAIPIVQVLPDHVEALGVQVHTEVIGPEPHRGSVLGPCRSCTCRETGERKGAFSSEHPCECRNQVFYLSSFSARLLL